MNAEWIITNFVIMDDLMMHLDHHSHPLAQVPDSEILIIAVVAPNTSPITMNAAWASCSNWAICRAESVYRGSIVGSMPWPTGWLLCPRRWGRCGPRAKFCPRLVARARVSARPSASLSQGAWADLLRLLRGQAREILRLASTVGLYHGGRAGFLRPPAGVLARFNPGA